MATTQSPAWIMGMKPYVPGKPIEELERELGITGSIKLASNENPYGTSPSAIEAMRDAAGNVHLYPDAGLYKLTSALAAFLDVPEAEIAVGNGSNELITLLVRAFCCVDDHVVFSRYGFIAYKVVTSAAGVPFTEVATNGFEQDLMAMAAACTDKTRVLFVANPNNPTGVVSSAAALREFLAAVPDHVLVVLDEAYYEFAAGSDGGDDYDGMALRDLRENLVVMRTFSKAYGLAGARVGYAVAPAEVVARLRRIREPFSVNMVAQAGAVAALADQAFVQSTVTRTTATRSALVDALRVRQIETVTSATNFVLMRAPGGGVAFYQRMLELGVIVRPLMPYGLPDYVRVSIGDDAENTRFIATLDQILAEGASS